MFHWFYFQYLIFKIIGNKLGGHPGKHFVDGHILYDPTSGEERASNMRLVSRSPRLAD